MSKQYWSDYWKHGHLTSFAQDIKDNYTGEIADFWQSELRELNEPGKTIVDIGTGNGALIDLALIKFGYDAPKYIGVDTATLRIPEQLKTENVEFLSDTQAEKLPLPDSSVNALISQFGIEYSDLNLSLEEASRVLAPGGKLVLMMHDNESTIVVPNRKILDGVNQIMGSQGAFAVLSNLVNALRKYGRGSPATEHIRNELNSKLKALADSNQHGLYGSGFPDMLKATMQAGADTKGQKENLKQFKKEMKALTERLDDLVGAALDATKKAWLHEHIQACGFSDINHGALTTANNQLVAHWVTAVKS